MHLRVLTYNAHLLPNVALRIAGQRSAGGYRARAIARQLVGYDIIGLCEMFDRRHTQALLKDFDEATAWAYQRVNSPKRAGRHWVHGGLVLLSRFPVEESHVMTYAESSRFLSFGFRADGFAAKGAIHARLRIDDHSLAAVDCFLTHLESQCGRAREHQIGELAEFIQEHSSPEFPTLVLGDLNTAADAASPDALEQGRHTPYQRLRRALSPDDRPIVDVWQALQQEPGGTSDALAADGGERIDYILMSDAASAEDVCLEPFGAWTLPMLDQRVPEGSLSDHLAVGCHAKLRYNEGPVEPELDGTTEPAASEMTLA